jgi:uncharacterized LabA/DUF88 family protein
MLFIDGTWLYYSLYQRQSSAGKSPENPIQDAFGTAWTLTHRIRWDKLPGIIAKSLSSQEASQSWGSGATRSIEVVRANVYTAYKENSDPNSYRVKMFEDMKSSNYDVHIGQVAGAAEKCVDIQLAVEMLHYATEADAYDVAVILTGDRDFEPAMFRTRQKGKRVALASMRPGCNKSLWGAANHLRDYDVVWLDDRDNLDQLMEPLEASGVGKDFVSGATVLMTIATFVESFKQEEGKGPTGRSMGRFLQSCRVEDNCPDLLTQVKTVAGSLSMFLGSYPDFFQKGTLTEYERHKDFSISMTKRGGQGGRVKMRIQQLWEKEVEEGRIPVEEEEVRELGSSRGGGGGSGDKGSTIIDDNNRYNDIDTNTPHAAFSPVLACSLLGTLRLTKT